MQDLPKVKEGFANGMHVLPDLMLGSLPHLQLRIQFNKDVKLWVGFIASDGDPKQYQYRIKQALLESENTSWSRTLRACRVCTDMYS